MRDIDVERSREENAGCMRVCVSVHNCIRAHVYAWVCECVCSLVSLGVHVRVFCVCECMHEDALACVCECMCALDVCEWVRMRVCSRVRFCACDLAWCVARTGARGLSVGAFGVRYPRPLQKSCIGSLIYCCCFC